MKFEDHHFEKLKLDHVSNDLWHQILMLRSKVFVVEQQCVYLDPDATDRSADHFILRSGDELIGYARAYEQYGWHLGRILIASERRGHRFGQRFIERILAEMPPKEVEMSAQVYLSEYYRSLGFEISGRMYLEDGIPHVTMTLKGR